MNTDASILKRIVKGIMEEEDDPLTPLIDEYLIKRKKKKYQHLLLKEWTLDIGERPRPGGRLSPSSLCGCERQALLKFLGTKGRNRTNPTQELIFEDGKWRHFKWGFIFAEMESILGKDRFQVVHVEHPIVIEDLYVAGHLDIEIRIKVGKKWRTYVVDFKGSNNFAFERAYRDRAPDATYIKQLITYMKGRGCKRGILLYDSKDKNDYAVFAFKLDQSVWGEVTVWCKKIIRQLEEKTLPPKHPDCNNGNFLYNRCQFSGLCFGGLSDRQIQRKVYIDFPGIEPLWKKGHKAIEEYDGG